MREGECDSRRWARMFRKGMSAVTAAQETPSQATPASAEGKAARRQPSSRQATSRRSEPSPEEGWEGINRREFLAYAWGAALALVALEGGYSTFKFMMPRFRAGEFGGVFELGPASALPPVGAVPERNSQGRYWLYHSEEGVKALYQVCTHLGCLYKWEPARNRFECPCHGSKFTADGDYIEGPAPRSLDQFVVEVVVGDQVVAQTKETETRIVPPKPEPPNALIRVQTGKKILGKPRDLSPAAGQG